MPSANTNPIERRLDILYEQWDAFVQNEQARLLRWVIEGDERPMIEAFLTAESDEEIGQTPDLFIRFSSAFSKPADHGFVLLRELIGQYAAAQDALREDGVSVHWQPPPIGPSDTDCRSFIHGCASLKQALGDKVRVIAAVLEPDAVADIDAYPLWLQTLVQQAPAEVRVISIEDTIEQPLRLLAASESVRVVSQPAELAMPEALEELSSASGGLETPAGQLRHLMVQLNKALSAKDLAKAERLTRQALALASAQKWYHLALAVHFMMAGGLMAASRLADAVGHYRAAETAAEEGRLSEDPEIARLCPGLKLKARLGGGSALLAAKSYELGAKHYEDTVAVALAASDPRAVIDCYRLASFCYEQNKRYQQAWDSGVKGLQAAQDLDQEVLKTSSLPYLGESLIRIGQRKEFYGLGARIDREMTKLMGRPDWRPEPAETAAVSGNSA